MAKSSKISAKNANKKPFGQEKIGFIHIVFIIFYSYLRYENIYF